MKVLLIEDNAGDARFIREMLSEYNAEVISDVVWVDRLSRGLDRLAVGAIDAVLLDLGLPDSQGLSTFDRIHEAAKQVPILILTAFKDDALALEAVRRGAQDYLLKGEINGPLLIRAISYATERKKLAEALKRQAELIDLSPDAIIVRKLDGTITFWSKGAEKLYGWTRSEAVGNKCQFLLRTNFSKLLRDIVSQIKKSGQWSGELYHKTKDEHEVVVQSWWLAEKDEHGELKGILETNVDITQKKQAEQTLKEAEKRYHTLFNHAPLGVVVIDPQTFKPVEFNDAAHHQLGYSREEFSKLGIPDFQAEETTDEISTHVDKIVKERGGEFETKHRTKSGAIRDVLVTTRAIEIAGKTFLYGIFHDITEIRRVQDALMKSETQYRQLVNVAQEGIWALDDNYRTVFVNPRMAEMLGYAQSEMAGKSLFDFLFNAEVKQAKKDLSKFKQEVKGSFEYEFTCKNGAHINASIAASKIKNDKGRTLGTLALVSDITLRKKMENELREETEKLENITESIGAGLTIISKDYRILWTNKVMKQIRGLPDLQGRRCYATYNYLDSVCPECGVKKVFEGKESDSREYMAFDREKGSTAWMQLIATPIRDKDGNVTAALELVLPITERKIMEQSLKGSEERFRTIMNSALDAIIAIDDALNIVAWNPAASLIFSYTEEEIIGKPVSTLIPFNFRRTIVQEMGKFIEDRSKDSPGGIIETVGVKKDGTEFPAELSFTRMQIHGKNLGVGFVRDITKRKKAEEALKKSEKEYSSLFSNMMDGFVYCQMIFDKAGKPLDFVYLQVNDAFERMTCLTRDQIIGKKVSEVIPGIKEDNPELFEVYGRVALTGQVEKNVHFQKYLGLWLNVSVYSPAKGFFAAVLEDVTEHKKAETALKNSEEKFRNLAEQSPNIIFINQKGRVVYANAEAEKATGYTKKEFYSPEFDYMDLIAPEFKEFVKSQFIKHMKGEDVRPYEYKLISKEGKIIDVMNSTKVINFNGEPAILGIETDISEGKKLKEKLEEYSLHLENLVNKRTMQLEQAQAQLVKSERLAAIGELAGMVGHDLRNPLAGIKNAVYFLKKKGATLPEAQQKQMFEIIENAINHSDNIINDLLDYSREMQLELKEIETSAILNEAIRMIQVPDRIQIVNHVLEETCVKVDLDKMLRVFINIIKNAIDAMPEKGTLEIRSWRIGGKVEIAFSDTGTGISDEVLPKVFSPLFTTKAQGMGFGLAICKRIIECHGGKITVKTAANKGTTFTITLPIKPKVPDACEKTWVKMPELFLVKTKE